MQKRMLCALICACLLLVAPLCPAEDGVPFDDAGERILSAAIQQPDSDQNRLLALLAHEYADVFADGRPVGSVLSLSDPDTGAEYGEATLEYDVKSADETLFSDWKCVHHFASDPVCTLDGIAAEFYAEFSALEHQAGLMRSYYDTIGMKLPLRVDAAELLSHSISLQPTFYAQFEDASGDGLLADLLVYYHLFDDASIYEDIAYVFVRFFLADEQGDTFVHCFNLADRTLGKQVVSVLFSESENVPVFSAQVKIRSISSVNVREQSDVDSAKVGTAGAGELYPCLSIAPNGWYEIELPDGTTGFVSPNVSTLIR